MPQGDAPRAAAASRARYRRIVRFATGVMLATWWFEVVLPRIGFARVAERGRTARLRRISARFRVLAIDLGGLMIKVGQFLSSRLDVLPPEVTSELEQLQDEVPAVPFAEIKALAESELGVPLHRAYAWFDETPVARHPSVRPTGRSSQTTTRASRGFARWSSRCSGRASTWSSRWTSPRSARSPTA